MHGASREGESQAKACLSTQQGQLPLPEQRVPHHLRGQAEVAPQVGVAEPRQLVYLGRVRQAGGHGAAGGSEHQSIGRTENQILKGGGQETVLVNCAGEIKNQIN